jgi:asparagine synthase (glutamine-hydrolysing)
MSVIHAVVDWSGRRQAPTLIERMIPASRYWQPDHLDRQKCSEGHWALAKASLYNTPRSKTDHVFSDASGKVSVCANARLDNRQALMEKLAIPVGQWGDLTDGQLILFAWQRWGERCTEYMLGDFVFIIWDWQQQRLFCARDQLGVKVLFYTCKGGVALVSNEHNALIETGIVDKAFSEEWLVRKLWGLGPRTFSSPWRDIQVLPPAHTLVIDADGIRLRRYWQLQTREFAQRRDEDLLAELDQRFQTAVQRRLDSSYPLGAELSEGLDSCGIAGVAARQLGARSLYTFSHDCIEESDQTCAVWGDTYKEIHEMLAMYENLVPVWSQANEDGSLASLDSFNHVERHFGGPLDLLGDNFRRPALAQAKGVRTLLSGWGGDHCVSSYGDGYESELFAQGRFADLHELFSCKYRQGRGASPARAWAQMLIKHYAPWAYRQAIARRRGLGGALMKRAAKHYLKPEYRRRYHCDSILRRFVDQYACYSVQARDWRELFTVGVENRLVESELLGHFYQVEFRFPMLDVELLEFSYSLPSHLKITGGIERYMFRQILEGVTTERIRWRYKTDVNRPNRDITEWVNKLQAQAIKDLNIETNPLVQRYCDLDKLRALISHPDPGLYKGITMLASISRWLAEGAIIASE